MSGGYLSGGICPVGICPVGICPDTGKEAFDRRGIGEDRRQLVMVRLAARWRCFNLVKLVALWKGNHPGVA